MNRSTNKFHCDLRHPPKKEIAVKEKISRCVDCGSTDLHQGYDIMIPLNKEPLELLDFLDGEYNDFIWCCNCEDECQGIEEVDQE